MRGFILCIQTCRDNEYQEDMRMSKKVIELNHDVRDYECMWCGMEFIYGNKTGEWVPDFGFFSMSGVGNFIYLKGENFRQAAWSNGMVNKMYDFMAPIVGFDYEYVEGLAFEEMIEKAKAEIDEGRPVILGPVDMYYLKYFAKIYRNMHIPMHYIMMTGYDEEKIYIIDGGVEQVQTLTYGEIKEALVSERTELGAGNGMYKVKFNEELPSVFEIAKKAFYLKAKQMLEPNNEGEGISAMRRLAHEFGKWREELNPGAYKAALNHLITFTGTVPQPPMRLFGAPEKADVLHRAGREKLVNVLRTIGSENGVSQWLEAADLFVESGRKIERITHLIVDLMLHQRQDLDEVPSIILEIADIEEAAYKKLLIEA